jgi:uncharacterized protein
MRVVIAGASGFLGTHLSDHLRVHGHEVTALVRREPGSAQESRWDPAAGHVDAALIESADAVVNLAGAPIAGNPHSTKWAREVLESRVSTTQLLAETIAATERPAAFLAGNGVAWYGDHGTSPVTEDSPSNGGAFLTKVSHEWSAAADPARKAGARVCELRTSPVMDRTSPPLKQLRLLFQAGGGARLGSGEQFMPMISLRDWVGAAAYLVGHPTADGPINLTCVDTPTNAEFTQALAAAVHRPAFALVPAPIIKLAAGQVAPEVLGSMNIRPQALLDLGYEFADPDVTAVLASGLS